MHVPGREPPAASELIPHDEVEIGMGIHNEPGSHRAKNTSLPDLVRTMLKQLLDQNDPDRAYISYGPDDRFALMINNLGSVSTLELAGITDEVTRQLANDWGIKPVRTLQGTYLTSLNGLGFSISLLKLVDTGLGPGKSLLELLDAPAEAVGWAAPVQTATWEKHANDAPVKFKDSKSDEKATSNLKGELNTLIVSSYKLTTV